MIKPSVMPIAGDRFGPLGRGENRSGRTVTHFEVGAGRSLNDEAWPVDAIQPSSATRHQLLTTGVITCFYNDLT